MNELLCSCRCCQWHETLRSEHPAAPPVRTGYHRRPLLPTHANSRRPASSPLRHTATRTEKLWRGESRGHRHTLNWPTARIMEKT